jgi:hypothetical protein
VRLFQSLQTVSR